MPKKVYLVRHGESEDGAKELHQLPDSPLSSLGIRQATKTAERFASIPVDKILSSPYRRAVQTAEIINSVVHREIVPEPLLRELKRPTEIEQHSIRDPKVVEIKQQIRMNAGDPSWHYSDEENLSELKARMQECRSVIERDHVQNILVVSHGVVMKVLVMVMLFGETATPDIYDVIYSRFRMTQSGITVMELRDDHVWKLLTWNDIAHLGEDTNELFYK